jgi:hypothetical protein
MQFKFHDGQGASGCLTFTSRTTTRSTTSGSSRSSPLLLVTDAGADAVHLVDVVGRSHAGYLASPGSIAGPRGVAVSRTSPLVAVSAWKKRHSSDKSDHAVLVYRGSGVVWEAVRVIGGGFGGPGSRHGDGQLQRPNGLRFSADGSMVCVADPRSNRVSVFRVDDGRFVRHIATGLRDSYDLEEVEGGWLVVCSGTHRVEFVGEGVGGDGGGGRPSLGKAGGRKGSGDGPGELWSPSALAVVPGLGLVVREWGNGRLQVFC